MGRTQNRIYYHLKDYFMYYISGAGWPETYQKFQELDKNYRKYLIQETVRCLDNLITIAKYNGNLIKFDMNKDIQYFFNFEGKDDDRLTSIYSRISFLTYLIHRNKSIQDSNL